jgi:hypothetical protein
MFTKLKVFCCANIPSLIFTGVVIAGATIYMGRQTAMRRKRILDNIQEDIVSSIQNDYVICVEIPPHKEFTYYKFANRNGSGKPHETVNQTLNPLLSFSKSTKYNYASTHLKPTDHYAYENLAGSLRTYHDFDYELPNDFIASPGDIIDVTKYNAPKKIYLYGSNKNEIFDVTGVSDHINAIEKIYICNTDSVIGLFGMALSTVGLFQSRWPSSK